MQTTPAQTIAHYTQAGWWGTDTLSSIFQRALKQAPDQLALCDPSNRETMVSGEPLRLTFTQIDQRVDELARHLFAVGLRQDDKIVLQMPNVAEVVLVYLACARLGLIVRR